MTDEKLSDLEWLLDLYGDEDPLAHAKAGAEVAITRADEDWQTRDLEVVAAWTRPETS